MSHEQTPASQNKTGATDEIVIQDAPGGSQPSITFGDVFQWLPVIERIIAGISAVLAGQATEIPAIRVKALGRKLTLGPIPVKVE